MSSDAYTLLVIGAGPAGLAAVRSFRRRRPEARIGLVGDEGRVPYSRPPLTKELLRGEGAIADLPIEAETWFDEQRIELISGRAVQLDAMEQTVCLSGGRLLEYTNCVLATGAEPRRLPIPGADHPRVAVLRTLEDLRRLQERLGAGARVAVIGSGFIACEVAASLRHLGHPVELISDEIAPNVRRLGPEAAARVQGWLGDAGVRLALGAPVSAIEHGPDGSVVVAGERRTPADVVVMATGVAPRGELAAQAGLRLEDGAIPVDAWMRTSIECLYAAGDVVLADNLLAARKLRVEHWGDALGQGEVAGLTAAGGCDGWSAVPGFWSTIGEHTLKYVAWGDGFDEAVCETGPDGAFVVRYGRDGKLVGVLTHRDDAAYERARDQIAEATPWHR